ncbi:MAG: B3/B4 domain-containing protein [Ardenticatenaceae bacterium]
MFDEVFVGVGFHMTTFQYHSDVLVRYPNLSGGVILAQSVTNGPTPTRLREVYLAEQRATVERIGNTPLSQIEPLAAWRIAFRQFGAEPTKYRSAPESLLRRLTKQGDIPLINCLVDIGNLVSIRYALPVAVFDTRALRDPVTVHFADGSERYTPLFEARVEHPEVGEVVFSDTSGLVIARRWCWRQADQSAARPDTQDAIITVEAQHPGGRVDVSAALHDLLELLHEYIGGSFTSGILGQDHPAITD